MELIRPGRGLQVQPLTDRKKKNYLRRNASKYYKSSPGCRELHGLARTLLAVAENDHPGEFNVLEVQEAAADELESQENEESDPRGDAGQGTVSPSQQIPAPDGKEEELPAAISAPPTPEATPPPLTTPEPEPSHAPATRHTTATATATATPYAGARGARLPVTPEEVLDGQNPTAGELLKEDGYSPAEQLLAELPDPCPLIRAESMRLLVVQVREELNEILWRVVQNGWEPEWPYVQDDAAGRLFGRRDRKAGSAVSAALHVLCQLGIIEVTRTYRVPGRKRPGLVYGLGEASRDG